MGSRQYRLFLINPGQQRRYQHYTAMTELGRMARVKKFMVPLALPVVASLTPDHYDVRIIDEDIQPLPGELPDLVGITTLGSTVGRVMEIADMYRARGVPVVLGGPMAFDAMPDLVGRCDAAVVGEAELSWPRCLADFERGRLRPLYRADTFCDFSTPPPPRWDLIDRRHVFQVGVQASRGCPFSCDFCLVPRMYGRKMRYRDVDNLVR